MAQAFYDVNERIKPIGLMILDVDGDGNCLFRSLSDQLYGTEDHHDQLRQEVCKYMEAHSDHFENFFTDESGETFEDHLEEMKELGTFGDNFELVAFANLYNVDIHIYRDDCEIVQIITGCKLEPNAPKEASNPSTTEENESDEPGSPAQENIDPSIAAPPAQECAALVSAPPLEESLETAPPAQESLALASVSALKENPESSTVPEIIAFTTSSLPEKDVASPTAISPLEEKSQPKTGATKRILHLG